MNDAVAAPVPGATTAGTPKAPIGEIFTVFLMIGAVSFGGGVVAYLRSSLVVRKKWLDDKAFLELTAISNSLPGLNATNMSILVGDRLAGFWGSFAAICGMCLPGFLFLTLAGVLYGSHHGNPIVSAMLKGVAAAAVGLIGATWYQIGKKTVRGFSDAFFILAAVLCVNHFKVSVPATLLCVGAFAIFSNRPRHAVDEGSAWIRFLH
jgi:chromate transporter